MKRAVVIVGIVAGAFALLGAAAIVVFLLWHFAQLRPSSSPTPAAYAPPGAAMDDVASFELAVYLPARPPRDARATVDALLAGEFAALRRVATPPDGVHEPQVLVRMERDLANRYTPPDADVVRRFGRGLTDAQQGALQEATEAMVLEFEIPRALVFSAGRDACALASRLAHATDGIVWDDQTREVFSAAAWDERRLASWTEPVPDVSQQIVIHSYRDDEYVRSVTLGMARFALPDLSIEESPWSSNDQVGHLLNLTAQRLAEGAVVGAGGALSLRATEIGNASVREREWKAAAEPHGTGSVLLVLQTAEQQEGDAPNRLWALTFERNAGVDVHSRLADALSGFFGSTDGIRNVEHDEVILAASTRARERLPALQEAFGKGLLPGEILMVKAGFDKPDGAKEWMWIEVTSWEGTRISGLLQNEPFEIPELHAGQRVTVAQHEVFDFLLKRPDGTVEGNETGPLIEARSAPPGVAAQP
jgi:uncharacterized protein YegJ (DUF2314 family)